MGLIVMNQPLFIFSKRSNLLSRLIRIIGNTKYSHVSMTLPSLKYHTIESAWNRPTVIKHFEYQKGSYDMYELNLELTKDQMDKLEWFIIRNISSGYDYEYFFSRGTNKLFNLPIINSKNSFTCDELILAAIKFSCDIDLVEDYKNLTPETLSRSKWLTRVS